MQLGKQNPRACPRSIETAILKQRIAAKLTLRELSDLVGLSPATLSLSERGLYKLQPDDERRVIQTIRRVAEVSRSRSSAIAAARKIDLTEFVADIREGRVAAA